MTHLVSDPKDLLKHLDSNALMKAYHEQMPLDSSEILVDDSQVVIFEGLTLNKVLFTREVRTSYYGKGKSSILYEINFLTHEIKIYQLQEKKLIFTTIAKLNPPKKEGGFEYYEGLNGTPLTFTLVLFHSTKQMALAIFDQTNRPLMPPVTSAHLMTQPALRLKGYLDYLIHCKSFGPMEHIVESYLPPLLQQVMNDENAITDLISDPHALHALIELKGELYRHHADLNSKLFVEQILALGLSSPRKKESIERVEEGNLFVYRGEEKVLLIKQIENLDQTTIEKTLTELQHKLVKYPQAVGNLIEFYAASSIDHDTLYGWLKQYKLADLNLKEIRFISGSNYVTFRSNHKLPFLHPAYYHLFEMNRLKRFNLEQELHYSTENTFIFFAEGKKEEQQKGRIKDERLIGYSFLNLEELEEGFKDLLERMKEVLAIHRKKRNLFYNRLVVRLALPSHLSKDFIADSVESLIEKFWLSLQEASIEKVIFSFNTDEKPYALEIKNILYKKPTFDLREESPTEHVDLVRIATSKELRELQVLSKGGVWSYRLPALITSIAEEFRIKELGQKKKGPRLWEKADSNFIELDLDHSKSVIDHKTGSIDYNYGELKEIERPLGNNEAGVVIGLKTDDLGIGQPVKRLLIIGDLSHSSKGAIRAQECARVNAAIRYAAKERIPIDWFAASFGVQVHREKGVEGLDAAASTIREIVKNCHHNAVQINLVIDETNIGAQSYWDSMAVILNETCGIMVMTPKGCMALTGPSALVSALYATAHSEEIPRFTKTLYPKGLQSLSGYENVHGPNSDSMLFAKNIKEACYLLLMHHYYSYVVPFEGLASIRPQVLEVEEEREEAKVTAVHKQIDNYLKGLKPNREIILDYLKDQNSPTPLHFWRDIKGIVGQSFRNGDLPQTPSTIVKELLIGGFPTLVIFTATGPLTPIDAEIVARAIYKANGRMQVLIIGSLSGFSCDPLSMENRQLQAGSYIAKAIVEHHGPILIVNLGNLVGGTFVVFNKQLNPDVRILAIEGSHVQVLGGKAAAKVVFHSMICKRADEDPRVLQYAHLVEKAPEGDPIHQVYHGIRNEVINEIEEKEAASFDQFHNAQRAVKVGSIDQIVSFENLRGSIILTFEEMRAKYLKKVA